MRMPGKNGVQLLEQFRQSSPDTIRLMLTGNADQEMAREAVNRGQVFRFLNKPCSTDVLALAIESALQTRRAALTERSILEETLNGSLSLLTEVLEISNPTVFGQISQLRQLIEKARQAFPEISPWEINAAAMLAYLGFIAVDSRLAARYFSGSPLLKSEVQIIQSAPAVAARLICQIPRLRHVAQIIRYQNELPHLMAGRMDRDEDVAAGNLLKCALEYLRQRARGACERMAIRFLEDHPQEYHQRAVATVSEAVDGEVAVQSISMPELRVGMILAEPLLSIRGDLLLGEGQLVTATMRERLEGIATTQMGVRQPFRVKIPDAIGTVLIEGHRS